MPFTNTDGTVWKLAVQSLKISSLPYYQNTHQSIRSMIVQIISFIPCKKERDRHGNDVFKYIHPMDLSGKTSVR